MRETKTKSIGQLDYTVTQLGATAGRKVLVRLAKVIGAGLGGPEPISGMLAAVNDDDMAFMCDQFAALTTVKIGDKSPGLKDIFEEHFAGKHLEMIYWLAFCIEVNFGSFLDAAGLSQDKLAQVGKRALTLTSPKEPSGASGG